MESAVASDQGNRAACRGIWPVLLALTLAVLTGMGCARTSPYEEKVDADSGIDMALWRSGMGNKLSAREWQLFDRALQETKYKIMMTKKAAGGDAVAKEMFARINGRPLFEVMRDGLQFRVERMKAEKEEFDELYWRVEGTRTNPGDVESADYLKWVRKTHTERKGRIEADLAEAEKDLADLLQFARPSP